MTARFLLVNPFYPISETPSPPLGLAFLAGALEAAGVDVEILDLVVFPYAKKRLQSILKRFDPQFVGFTAVTMNIENALSVLRDVKSLSPDIMTVMGGPHVTFCAEETMRAVPEIDFVVLGEGEETVVELVASPRRPESWSHIRGLVYRDGDGISSSGPRPFIQNIDTLPDPARHLVPLGRYRALGLPVSMTTSRGCPFKCIFCVGRKMVGGRVRYRNPLKVVDELAYLDRLDFSQINIADDLFTAAPRHCLSVCDEIIARGMDVRWTSFARVDTVSPEVLQRMKAAGCTAVSFGVETGNPEMLKRIKKGITLDQVVAAVEMCTDAGITPHASFILGLPGETRETIAETVAFGEKLKAMGVLYGFHLLAPFPGTAVRENCRNYDLKIESHDWNDYHANRAIVSTRGATREMLDKVVLDWEKNFDIWLDKIKTRRASGEADEEEAWPLTNLEHTVLLYDMMMKRVLENLGPVPGDMPDSARGEPTDSALEHLVERIQDFLEPSREEILNTLRHAVRGGYLRLTEKEGFKQWEWVNYL
ncbi:MAG: B12-binding domain-containing radical SAM protein [Deltaproteobacteria bacterium]|nr:B12-binding domain-containing radical SAM protein [Deltaproteobacteria bacterium]